MASNHEVEKVLQDLFQVSEDYQLIIVYPVIEIRMSQSPQATRCNKTSV